MGDIGNFLNNVNHVINPLGAMAADLVQGKNPIKATIDAGVELVDDLLHKDNIADWGGPPSDQNHVANGEAMLAHAPAAAAPGSDFVAPAFDPAALAGDAKAAIDPEVAAAFARRDQNGDGVLTGTELDGIEGVDKPWLNPQFGEIDGAVTLEQFAQRAGEIKERALPAYEAEQAAKIKAFKDFLLTDTIFGNDVNTATDAKYDDWKILKAVQDFYDAGKAKGLNDDEIKSAVKDYSEAFKAWQKDTSSPRPEPDQFLQHRYKLSVL